MSNKLEYIIETESKNGQFDSHSESFSQDQVIIGRGGKSEIILDSALVSLEHAKLSFEDSQLIVEDLGSVSGVKVKNSLVKRYTLKSGDVVRVGDISLNVSLDQGSWTLTERRRYKETKDSEVLAEELTSKLSIANRLPSLFVLSAVISLVVAGYYFCCPFVRP